MARGTAKLGRWAVMNDSTLCVGADAHRDDIVLRAVDKLSGHEVIESFSVANNVPGAQSALTTIARVAAQMGYTRIDIGWEATGMLWIAFHRTLGTSPLLEPFDLKLVCFNPKLVANFMNGLVLRGPKNARCLGGSRTALAAFSLPWHPWCPASS